MTWFEYHTISSQFASDAEMAARKGDVALSRSLYSQAANAEEGAVDCLETKNKQRTLAVTVISMVSLYYKANLPRIAKSHAERWISSKALPEWATKEIQDILSNRKETEE